MRTLGNAYPGSLCENIYTVGYVTPYIRCSLAIIGLSDSYLHEDRVFTDRVLIISGKEGAQYVCDR